MTQEDKQLLVKDLCGRLKSNLICKVTYKDSEGWKEEDMEFSGIINDEGYFTSENGSIYSSEFKPYLRPMSSMTEEEYWDTIDIKKGECNGCVLTGKGDPNTEFMLVDFYNKHRLDYRGLIPMGLALEASEDMYNKE